MLSVSAYRDRPAILVETKEATRAMPPFSDVPWSEVLSPTTPILEIFVRGTIVYLALFLLIRIVFKRQPGTVGISDLLVVVLIADASQSAMAPESSSVADGLLLVATIVFWSYTLDWLGYHVPALERIVHPPPLLLVENGQLLRGNMRKELVTKDELMTQLREQGVEDLAEVKRARIEGDGRISFVTHDKQERQPPEPRRT
jgi:uncharacterized membrane protein YcaP (DUF421 family)